MVLVGTEAQRDKGTEAFLGEGDYALPDELQETSLNRAGSAKMIRTFRDLIVWQRAMELVDHANELSANFPSEERFALTSQFHRSAGSIPANIAEGYGRGSRGDYLRFLKIARGSLYETETHVEIARRRRWLNPSLSPIAFDLIREVDRLLSALIRRLEP